MAALDDKEKDVLSRLLSAPIFFPETFKTWLTDFIGTNIPLIPYTHFFGAQANTARSGNTVLTSESTGSATYTDLSTVGPQVAGLQDGTYVVFFGCDLAGQGAYAGVQVNSTPIPNDDDSLHESEIDCSGGRAIFVTLKNDNNSTLTMKYRKEGGATATFKNRWMSVLRVGAG